MSISYIESLPERCLELILDYLNLVDFNATIQCCNRLRDIGKEVRRMREIRLHQVLRQNGIAKWNMLHSNDGKKKEIAPGKRFGSTVVYFESSIYLFGGATVNWTSFNDLWKFDLNTKSWSRRIPRGTCPPPRASATGIIFKDKLIIIGGFELLYSMHAKGTSNWDNSPWIYNFTSNEWTMVTVDTCLLPKSDDDCSSRKFTISPTPVGQSFSLLLGDKVVLFGGAKALLNQSQGYHRQNPVHPHGLSNETYCLSMSTVEISAVKVFGDVKPFRRCGHSALSIDRNKMVIIGGNLGPNTKGTEDMWMLTCVDPIIDSCVCDSSHDSSDYGSVWYWTKINLNTKLQPPRPFLSNAAVFIGEHRVMRTMVVLGGVSEETDSGTNDKKSRLMVHSMDLSSLLTQNQCSRCHGDLCRPRDCCEEMSWVSTVVASQDLEHAPITKQGFGLVFGADSVFVFGGVKYKSMMTRPVYLLNDFMVRDAERDSDDDGAVTYGDLHQLTFAAPTISL